MNIFWKCLHYKKTLAFLGGVLTATAGVKVLKSEPIRKATVSAMAKGMQMQQNAMSTLETLKEEAQDLCHEAKEAAMDQEESDGQ